MVRCPYVGSIQLLAVSAFTHFPFLLHPNLNLFRNSSQPLFSIPVQTTIISNTDFSALFLIELVVCLHDLRGKQDGWIQEVRKKGKKEIKKEVETDILDKFEFLAGGTRSLTRRINDVSTAINYYLFHLATCFQLRGSLQASSIKYTRVKGNVCSFI